MNIYGRVLLFLILISQLIDQGSCLWCYQCFSNQSWTDCENHLYRRKCQDPEVFCLSAEIQLYEQGMPKKVYSRMCSTTGLCSGRECVESKIACRLMCCNSNYCNGDILVSSSGHNTSTFVIIGTVLMAFIFFGG